MSSNDPEESVVDSAYETTSTPDPQRRRSPRNSNGSDTQSSKSEKKLHRVRKNPKPKRLNAEQEITYLTKTTDLLIPHRPFQRVVREILQKYKPDARIQSQAFAALQESAEMYLINMFEDALLMTAHRKRLTLESRDLILAQHLRKDLAFFVTK